jgi:hypothetical protein
VHDVAVRILHPEAGPSAGPLGRMLADARRANAERLAGGFARVGTTDVRIVAGPPDDTPFGRRLRALVGEVRRGGLVVAASGALPLAGMRDLRAFVEVAAAGSSRALANNRFSADVVAIACIERLGDPPDLPTDNVLPRWLEEAAGYAVADLRGRWRLAVDLDSPLDLALVGRSFPELAATRARLAAVAAVAGDPRAELVVAGRSGGTTLGWLERHAAARVRALVEERGLRTRRDGQRPARSIVGLILDRDGPSALGTRLAELGDAAVVDSRVLLAHRLGADDRAWPSPEDRFASDLGLAERIVDPWLRALTESAVGAPIPVVLGGHTLVGPGVRLVVRRAAA